MQVLPALAAGPERVDVALLTHADGPHLSAYIEGLAKTPEVGRVWVADAATETMARRGLGEKLAGVYPDAAALLRAQKPKLAIIPMEAKLAPPVVDAALEAGCHVMAEKPACVRAEDFAKLAAKANARKQMLLLAFANRLDPLMKEARRLVQGGAIGRMYGMEMHIIADQTRLTRTAYHNTWTAQRGRAGGGHLIWLGIHWLDLAAYITGSPVTEIAGFTGNVGKQPIDTEDSAAMALRFANGSFGTLTSGYYLDRSKQLYLKFWGEKGWVEMQPDRTDFTLLWQVNGHEVQQSKPAGPNGYTAWVRHVTRAAAGLEAPVLTADESLQALRTVFAGYRAAETGRTQRTS
ncbi:MAG TPA: Gfo/Idh/MocA family oxidoreductase [Bryobacteraceae bacterium]|nr:Gfo/Idh/MocA family oxidoreductase [Bryobacteraceae bacterium]